MDQNKEQVRTYYSYICHLKYPEQLFGDLGLYPNKNSQLQILHEAFRYLMKCYHPDIYSDPTDKHYANEVCITISSLRELAKKKIENGTYGQLHDSTDSDTRCTITTSIREYRVIEHLVEGKFADIFLGAYVDPDNPEEPIRKVAIKIIADPDDNHLLKNEIRFYRRFAHFSVPHAKPQYVDRFVVPDERKQAIIMSYIDGYDLTVIRESYPQGISDRHVCWILDRLLSVLGLLHAQKILHGNIEPENIIVQPHPYAHHGFLIDFLFCLIEPDSTGKMAVINREYTAPEVFRGMKPHPVSELYALGKSMIYLLGGDVRTDTIPDSVDPRIAAFLRKFLIKDPAKRANDAWQMHAELQNLRQRVFGARHEGLPFYV